MSAISSARIALSQRGEIRLGFRCNARCGFCYYQDLLDNPRENEPKTEELRQQLRTLRAQGATEIEFTGGEPTICPDLVPLIRYAKELGFVNVSMITNGLRLSSDRFARQVVEAGVNDILFSIHGHSSELHDAHTKIPGSFDRILKAISNVQKLGARCRGSATVTGKNHMHATEIVAKMIELKLACIHLAVFSPVAQASSSDEGMAVRYSDAAASIKRAIDANLSSLPLVSVKYIPFCFMKGYEKYVMNLYQQSFDPDDWNYYFSNKVRRGSSRVMGALFDAIVYAGALLAKDRGMAIRYGSQGLKVFGLTRIVELLRKKRPAACRTCSFDLVCDHVWKNYATHFGTGEVTPVTGLKVRHPAWSYEMAGYRVPGVKIVA